MKENSHWELPATVISAQELELRPAEVSSMSTDLSNHFFVTLDTPEGTDVVSVDETAGCVVLLVNKNEKSCCSCSGNRFELIGQKQS